MLASPSTADRLRRIRHVALDLDGTIYRGGTLFDFTNPFLALLRDLKLGVTFLTNNSSKNIADYVSQLRRMGVAAAEDQIRTSTQATLEYLREERPDIRRVFMLGTASMGREIAAGGYVLTADDPRDEPDAVIVGFDTGLTFARLGRAAWWIGQGKAFIASHPDRVCPTDQPTVLVDCGAVCAALQSATDRGPDAVLGKPHRRMLHGVLQRHGLEADELAMAGDRIYTDVRMARDAGALAVLVLTGEGTAAEAVHAAAPPDLIVEDLAEFGRQLRAAREP